MADALRSIRRILMPAFHRILCGTDFSTTSLEALDVALSLARDTGAEVHVVNVVPDPLTQPWMVEGAGMDFGELRQVWSSDAERVLKHLLADRRLDGRVTSTVLMGTPASELVQYVSDHACDLMVIGSHGHGVVRRFLLGSVADRVFKSAACAVLVVPHRTFRPALADMEQTPERLAAVTTA
jgi:nucleotide-binding universal stress UspA family protein